MEIFLIKIQLKWLGHLILPKQLFYGQLKNSPPPVAHHILLYKDKLKDNLISDAILILKHGENWLKTDSDNIDIVS